MEHHVYFWLKDERNNPGDRETFERGLAELFAIPHVAGGRWSVPAPTEKRAVTDNSWDYAMAASFATLADHDAYQVDADHDVFVAAFKDWWQKVLVMDLK
jgi:hypothetical protein